MANQRMNEIPMRYRRLSIKTCLIESFSICFTCFLLVSCGGKSVSLSPDERKEAFRIVQAARNMDSLSRLQKRLENEGNRLGSIVALREWARCCAMRAASMSLWPYTAREKSRLKPSETRWNGCRP